MSYALKIIFSSTWQEHDCVACKQPHKLHQNCSPTENGMYLGYFRVSTIFDKKQHVFWVKISIFSTFKKKQHVWNECADFLVLKTHWSHHRKFLNVPTFGPKNAVLTLFWSQHIHHKNNRKKTPPKMVYLKPSAFNFYTCNKKNGVKHKIFMIVPAFL